MRLSQILSPLGMLLLCSCEPGHGTADAENGLLHRKSESNILSAPPNESSHERLAAQSSVGRPPVPLNLVATVDDTCPVHHEKMKMREVPIVFSETASVTTPSTAEFPFAAESIVSSGNALLPGEPTTARVYLCASCIAAKAAADTKREPSGTPVASQ